MAGESCPMRQLHFRPHAVNTITKMGILPVDPHVLVCQAGTYIISNGNLTFSAASRLFFWLRLHFSSKKALTRSPLSYHCSAPPPS